MAKTIAATPHFTGRMQIVSPKTWTDQQHPEKKKFSREFLKV